MPETQWLQVVQGDPGLGKAGVFCMVSRRYTSFLMVVILLTITMASLDRDPSDDGLALKYLEVVEGSNVMEGSIREVINLGDLDQDQYDDLAITFPLRDSNGPDSGSVAIFWGAEDGFPPLDIANADLVIHGDPNSLFGQSLAVWDQSGNGWDDLIIGAPNADNGSGIVYVFHSNKVNGATQGSVFTTAWADFEINLTESHFFGSVLHSGAMSDDELDDLMVLSFGDEGVQTKAAFYLGGITPDRPYEIMLENGSVNNKTRTVSMDLYGGGVDSFIYSSPDRGTLTVVNMEVTIDAIMLPGANSTGVVDFNRTLVEDGNTWGWNAGDDGWDTSPYHIYDSDSGDNYIRWNEPTGNPRGHDRSVETIGKLFIEVGGVLGNSGGTDQSGAYGVSFTLTDDNITDASSAILSFNYEWEDWGFENNERIWVKSRLWDSTGDITWLGRNVDTDVQNDATPEVYTMKGVNGGGGAGRNLFGRGSFNTDILPLIDGPGEYYLDMGGKISRWTQANEFGGFGFDNISLKLRTVDYSLRKVTGSGQLGTDLSKADVNGDGHLDLIVSSPQDGRIRIFNGSEPYWLTKAVNQGDANYTIEGPSGADFGYGLLIGPPSPFLMNETLLVSMPQATGAWNGSGVVHRFKLPLEKKVTTVDDVIDSNYHPEEFYNMGMEILSIGDQDGNGYPELLFFGFNSTFNLVYARIDGSPTPPELKIVFPKRHATVSGDTAIRVSLKDVDGDCGPEDVRFYRSIDNRSWILFGSGVPDRIEGDVAVKEWNTKQYENSGYFFRVTAEDDFGLTTVLYTDRIDVFNHVPPFVDLTQPSDGSEIRGNQQISARITVPSDEVLVMPVRFLYSRDNETWVEFGNRTKSSGTGSDYSLVFNTEILEDGPIWFRVNATTEYGLGRNGGNIDPVHINNYYYPEVNISSPQSNTTLNETVNVTAVVTDIDDDLIEPVTFNIKRADDELFDLVGNMTFFGNDTFFYKWDTRTIPNGEYDIMVLAEDDTFLQTEGLLNATIRIKNMYPPTILLKNLEEGDVITGLWTFSAAVNDPDLNFKGRNIVFEYSLAGEENWTSMDTPVFTDPTATVTWDTTEVANVFIDVRVTVTDDDGLSDVSKVEGIEVKNPYEPLIYTSFPESSIPLSGVVRLNFTISDDQPLPPGSVVVEISSLGTWIRLEGVTRITTGGSFEPWMNISFYVEWDTEEIDDLGFRVYPDGPGYDVRITVSDSEELSSFFTTRKSFEIKNKEDADDDDDTQDSGLGLPGWAIALIVLGLILFLVFIFLFFLIWSGRKKEKDVPLYDSEEVKKKSTSKKEEAPPAPVQEDIYSPGGWGATQPAPAAVPLEDDIYTGDTDFSDIGLDLGTESEEDLTDVRDSFFGGEKEVSKPRADVDLDDEVEVELPDGVMPEAGEDWDDEVEEEDDWDDGTIEDEWDDAEEEEFEEMDELMDMEEDEWEDVEEDEDEWEDMEEEEDIIVECKCGEEIEIPSDFKGSRFRCPECGRKGKIPGR